MPDEVPEALRELYAKKGFGLEHNGTQEEWAALHTHEMADILARELAALAPLQQLMRRMRQSADAAQAILERETVQQAPQKPARLTVRGADEFEF